MAILFGLVLAAALPAPAGGLPGLPLLLIYILAVLTFVRHHRLFLPIVLVDVICAAWLLGSDANRAALSPSLLTAAGLTPAQSGRRTAGLEPRIDDSGLRIQDTGPFILEGLLRQDASVTPSGASLSIEVQSIQGGRREAEGGRAQGGGRREAGPATVSGGAIASVSGSLALARLDEWRAGRIVRAAAVLRLPTTFGNPGLRDERLALARRGIHAFASIKSGALVETVRTGSWWAERAADVRAYARGAVRQAVGRWSEQSAAIVIAILIGDRAGLTSDVERRLQDAGTYHVIAISGGNIAILAGFLLGLCRLLEIRARAGAWITIFVLVAYADVVGGGASVVRATLMAVTYMTALAFDLRGKAMNALFAAACLILCATPLAVYDVAFALTFGATLAILAATAWLGSRMPRRAWLRAPAGLLLASAAAELALLPVGALAFSRVTFAGLVLNFFAIPLMALAQLAGTFVLPLAAIDARLAAIAGYCAHVGASGLVSTASLVDFMPALTWRVPAPAGPVIALYYAAFLMWCAAAWAVRHQRVALATPLRRIALVAFVVSATWILWSPLARLRGSRATGLLRLTVIDVGQADALLVRFPDSQTMLIDSGGSRAGGSFDVGMRVIAPVLWRHDVFRIDRFVLSHGDPDHIGGAVALLRAFRVGALWEGIDVPRDLALQQMHAEADARRVKTAYVRAGDRLRFGGADVRISHPPPPEWERQKIRNDDSIVLEIGFGGVSLLLTGDISAQVERTLRGLLPDVPIRIMKAPHHGSTGSSSAPFLAEARPALAIFTVGPAALGLPSLRDVRSRYAAIGARTLCTGDDGAVEVETDGHEVRVTTFSGKQLTLRAGERRGT